MARGAWALALALAPLASTACREHVGPVADQAAPAPAPGAAGSAVASGTAGSPSATTRVLYPSTPGSFVDLVEKARPGVVAIHAAAPVKSGPAAMFPGAPETTADVALGTGFLIEAKGVYVLTNDHIAAASSELVVVLPDRTAAAAKVIGRDPALDVALLQIDSPAQPGPRLTALPLGDSTTLKVGEWLVVLGDAFGDEVTASAGIVSATGHEGAGSLAAGRPQGFRTFIQTDARIHRGNSGGPVLDTAGQVIGVAVATSDRVGELSFVIPIERIREVVGALRDVGTVQRSWLGATVLPITAALVEQLALPSATGALITGAEPDSPASRAGLRAGDVILQWDGNPVDHATLPWRVARTPVGKSLPITIWRNKAEQTIKIVTERMRQ